MTDDEIDAMMTGTVHPILRHIVGDRPLVTTAAGAAVALDYVLAEIRDGGLDPDPAGRLVDEALFAMADGVVDFLTTMAAAA
jgi:hypothetical protein